MEEIQCEAYWLVSDRPICVLQVQTYDMKVLFPLGWLDLVEAVHVLLTLKNKVPQLSGSLCWCSCFEVRTWSSSCQLQRRSFLPQCIVSKLTNGWRFLLFCWISTALHHSVGTLCFFQITLISFHRPFRTWGHLLESLNGLTFGPGLKLDLALLTTSFTFLSLGGATSNSVGRASGEAHTQRTREVHAVVGLKFTSLRGPEVLPSPWPKCHSFSPYQASGNFGRVFPFFFLVCMMHSALLSDDQWL